MDFSKMAEKFGGIMLNASQIVFGGVVVKGLFGDGSDKTMFVFAICFMLMLLLVGIFFSSIKLKRAV